VESQPNGKVARAISLAVTNCTKLAGVAVAVHESLFRTELRPIVIGVAALMIAGAQGLETFLDKLFGR
jgi:hypothetical protein